MSDFETSINGCAGLPPSVARFHAVCAMVALGVERACCECRFAHLERQPWLAHAFELLSQDPLANPANDWKFTLTLSDEQIVTDGTLKAMRALVDWAKTAPPKNTLAAALKALIVRYAKSGVMREDVDGNLLLDPTLFIALRRAMQCPAVLCAASPELHFDVNFQFDHTWNCCESAARLRSVFQFFRSRMEAYARASDDALRRRAFTIDPRDNLWFTYYVKEFSNPTALHLPFTDPDVADASRLESAMACIDAMSEEIVAAVVRDTTDEIAADAAKRAWSEVNAAFVLRAASGRMPSYSAQLDFARTFGAFAKDFSTAVDSIGREKEKCNRLKTAEVDCETKANGMVGKDVDAAKVNDPLVTESHLVSACEKYYSKTKRLVCDKIRTVKNFVVKCQNESPPIRTPGMRGRKLNDVRAFQFERAILYQMGHRRCSKLNACKRSFLALENGYSSSRSTYDYWGDHRVEAEVTVKSLAVRAAEAGLTVTKYYDAHYLEHKSILRELNP